MARSVRCARRIRIVTCILIDPWDARFIVGWPIGIKDIAVYFDRRVSCWDAIDVVCSRNVAV